MKKWISYHCTRRLQKQKTMMIEGKREKIEKDENWIYKNKLNLL